MSSMSTRWYYRLGNDESNAFQWTGAISMTAKVGRPVAKKAICKRHFLRRLPKGTVVVSCKEMIKTKGEAARLQRTKQPVAVKPAMFKNGVPSMADIQKMLAMLNQ